MSVRVQIEALAGAVGAFRLLPVTLDIIEGEYLVLLGPSGCGKTTLVELLCGLRRPTSGRVFIGGIDVTYADPADRHTGYVPQDYLLFPSRTALWNLRCPAWLSRRCQENAEERFATVVKMLRLEPFLSQPVQTLSGGEKQRVALGRALMAMPDILLLDEPVSALPESLRDRVCRELKALQRELRITTIHVCHNLDEALSVADRLAVMDVGRLVQTGPPDQVLDRPANRFVAEFTHCKNLWQVEVVDGKVHLGTPEPPGNANHSGDFPEITGLPIGRLTLYCSEIASTELPNGRYWAMVRPEYLSLDSDGVAARVVESTRTPHAVLTRVDMGLCEASIADDRVRETGTEVRVTIPPERVHLVAE